MRQFAGKPFQGHKIYSNSPSWLVRSRCHILTFLKAKGRSSHFWDGKSFRFYHVEVQHERRYEFLEFIAFCTEKCLYEKICSVKAKGLCLKISSFLGLLVVSMSQILSHLLWPGRWHVILEAQFSKFSFNLITNSKRWHRFKC